MHFVEQGGARPHTATSYLSPFPHPPAQAQLKKAPFPPFPYSPLLPIYTIINIFLPVPVPSIQGPYQVPHNHDLIRLRIVSENKPRAALELRMAKSIGGAL